MKNIAKKVLEKEAKAILGLIGNIDDTFCSIVDLICNCAGHTIVTGIGKSNIIGRKFSATLSSTGTPSFFINATNSLHGDFGAVTKEDIIVAISNSGETVELLQMLKMVKNNIIIGVTSNIHSSLSRVSNYIINTNSGVGEACPLGLTPTSSTTATLSIMDALAVCVMYKRKFTKYDFLRVHPGGTLGKEK
jgi:arabinose-5-phosphate isomerase